MNHIDFGESKIHAICNSISQNTIIISFFQIWLLSSFLISAFWHFQQSSNIYSGPNNIETRIVVAKWATALVKNLFFPYSIHDQILNQPSQKYNSNLSKFLVWTITINFFGSFQFWRKLSLGKLDLSLSQISFFWHFFFEKCCEKVFLYHVQLCSKSFSKHDRETST